MCLSVRAIMSEAVVHTFLKKRGETKRYVGDVVSFGGGSYRCVSRVMPLSFLSQAQLLNEGEKIVSFRIAAPCAWLTLDLLFCGFYNTFLWKGIKWEVIYRLLNGHFLECRLFFRCVRLVCTKCVQPCIWCSFGSLDCMMAALTL